MPDYDLLEDCPVSQETQAISKLVQIKVFLGEVTGAKVDNISFEVEIGD